MYSWPSLVFVAIIAFFLIKGAGNLMIKERQSAERVEVLEAEKSAIEAREAELKGRISRLQTEEGVMEEIREKFSVAREGEYMAIIVDDTSGSTTSDKTAGERLKGWWQGFVNLWRGQ